MYGWQYLWQSVSHLPFSCILTVQMLQLISPPLGIGLLHVTRSFDVFFVLFFLQYTQRKPCSSRPFGVTGFHFAVVFVVEYPAKTEENQNLINMNIYKKKLNIRHDRVLPDSDLLLSGSARWTSGMGSFRPSASLSPDDACSSALMYRAGLLWYLARYVSVMQLSTEK